jgi:RHS repeat-associated protein
LKADHNLTIAYIHGMSNFPLIEKVDYGGGELTKLYVYGPTGLIAVNDNGGWFFLLKDHLGSTRVVLNENNNVVSSYDYMPYGGIMRSRVNTDIAYQFTGQEYDTELGLHNFRARLYDSDLAMFYAMDPAGQTYSPFAYSGNNPVIYVDEDGRFFWAAVYYAWQAYKIYSYASMAYSLYEGYQQGGFSGMMQNAVGIGASMIVGGAVGDGIGGSGIFGNSFGGTVLAGMTSGAISGGLTSKMFGGSFGDGALYGGLGGGLSAGAGWIGNHAKLNMEADALGLSGESAGPATDKNLKGKADEWYGREEGKDGLKTLQVARKDNIPDGYSIDENGGLVKDGKAKGGITFGGKWTDVRMSASEFSSTRVLYLQLGHEFVHVDQHYHGMIQKWRKKGDAYATHRAEFEAYYYQDQTLLPNTGYWFGRGDVSYNLTKKYLYHWNAAGRDWKIRGYKVHY